MVGDDRHAALSFRAKARNFSYRAAVTESLWIDPSAHRGYKGTRSKEQRMVATGREILLALIAVSLLIVPRPSRAQITSELVEAAKKEGEVMFYGAITVNSSKAIGDAFEKKYGIKLQHWRGDATELINRTLAEARS
jgi:hypothetical protein